MRDPADNLTLPLPVTAPTRLRFVSPTRVYSASLTDDLPGDWIVTQAWSGRDSNRGGGKTIVVENEEKGLALCRQLPNDAGSIGINCGSGGRNCRICCVGIKHMQSHS